jgi:hypothetical protein
MKDAKDTLTEMAKVEMEARIRAELYDAVSLLDVEIGLWESEAAAEAAATEKGGDDDA